MFKKVLAIFALSLVVVCVIVAIQPGDFAVKRSQVIKAPPAAVFAQLNDFHQWEAWSPWAKMDPEMQKKFDGPASGEGASYSWIGNSKVGEGKMTLLKSVAPESVQIRLDFLKPMEATNFCEFILAPGPEGTLVTWTMTGTNGFMGKAISLLMNMDKLVGADFERGLLQLKEILESAGK